MKSVTARSAALVAAMMATVGVAACTPAASSTGAASPSPATAPPTAASQPASSPASTVPASAVPEASGSTAPATSAATPTAAATAGNESCADWAASHTYAQFDKATIDFSDGALTITGHAAKMVCGGPDDVHYDIGAAETVHVPGSGTFQVWDQAANGDRTIAHRAVAAYLAGDQNTRVFLITGTTDDATQVAEQYHP